MLHNLIVSVWLDTSPPRRRWKCIRDPRTYWVIPLKIRQYFIWTISQWIYFRDLGRQTGRRDNDVNLPIVCWSSLESLVRNNTPYAVIQSQLNFKIGAQSGVITRIRCQLPVKNNLVLNPQPSVAPNNCPGEVVLWTDHWLNAHTLAPGDHTGRKCGFNGAMAFWGRRVRRSAMGPLER